VTGIDELLVRLRDDPSFVAALASDPGAALVGLDLTADDLDALAERLRPPGEVPEAVVRFADLFGERPPQ
jgi:hypothetical protein